jgi:hypothetical protein
MIPELHLIWFEIWIWIYQDLLYVAIDAAQEAVLELKVEAGEERHAGVRKGSII